MMVIPDGPTFVLSTFQPGIPIRHSWTIRNDGLNPLKLRTHFTSGRCGFSLWLGQEEIVAPGGEFVVWLTLTTPRHDPLPFSSHAEVWTNDPNQPRIKFKLMGTTRQTP